MDQIDKDKLDYTTVPVSAITALAKVMDYGAKKYTKDGYRRVPEDKYVRALWRHLIAYLSDHNSLDAESGLPSIWHVLANAAILADRYTGRGDKTCDT